VAGTWQVGGERATLAAPGGRIVYRFHARDLHLVLGPGAHGKPVRFRVTLDGAAPGAPMARTSTRRATAPSAASGCISSSGSRV
jgi:hypothetical protein